MFPFFVLAGLLGACGPDGSSSAPPPDGVLIRVDHVLANGFQQGKATECSIVGEVVNNTKFKIEKIAFNLGGVGFQTDTVHASQTIENAVLSDVDLSEPADKSGLSCSDIARAIVAHEQDSPLLDCSMTNVAEGDCQKLTVLAIRISESGVAAVQNLENEELALQREADRLQHLPLPQALAELLAKKDDNTIADFMVRTDAQSWSYNRYNEGTAHVTQRSVDPTDGTIKLHAGFRYFGNGAGWVTVSFYSDLTKVPCLEFSDTDGACNPLRIPDAMKPVTPPAQDLPSNNSATVPPQLPNAGAEPAGQQETPQNPQQNSNPADNGAPR